MRAARARAPTPELRCEAAPASSAAPVASTCDTRHTHINAHTNHRGARAPTFAVRKQAQARNHTHACTRAQSKIHECGYARLSARMHARTHTDTHTAPHAHRVQITRHGQRALRRVRLCCTNLSSPAPDHRRPTRRSLALAPTTTNTHASAARRARTHIGSSNTSMLVKTSSHATSAPTPSPCAIPIHTHTNKNTRTNTLAHEPCPPRPALHLSVTYFACARRRAHARTSSRAHPHA